jgi:hypothetical protein
MADEIRMNSTPSVFVGDLDAAQGRHADHRERQGERVPERPRHRGGDGDRPDELDRDALAEVDPLDREVEEQVHQRGRDAEHGRPDQVAAGPAVMEPGDTASSATAAPITRNQATISARPVEHRDGDRRPDVLRHRREDEQRFGRCGRQDAGRASHRAMVARTRPQHRHRFDVLRRLGDMLGA